MSSLPAGVVRRLYTVIGGLIRDKKNPTDMSSDFFRETAEQLLEEYGTSRTDVLNVISAISIQITLHK